MGVNYEIPKWLRIFIFSIGKKKKQKQLLLSNGSWQFESHSAAFEPNGSIQLISSNAFGQFGTGDDILNASRFHKHTIRFMVQIHNFFCVCLTFILLLIAQELCHHCWFRNSHFLSSNGNIITFLNRLNFGNLTFLLFIFLWFFKEHT